MDSFSSSICIEKKKANAYARYKAVYERLMIAPIATHSHVTGSKSLQPCIVHCRSSRLAWAPYFGSQSGAVSGSFSKLPGLTLFNSKSVVTEIIPVILLVFRADRGVDTWYGLLALVAFAVDQPKVLGIRRLKKNRLSGRQAHMIAMEASKSVQYPRGAISTVKWFSCVSRKCVLDFVKGFGLKRTGQVGDDARVPDGNAADDSDYSPPVSC